MGNKYQAPLVKTPHKNGTAQKRWGWGGGTLKCGDDETRREMCRVKRITLKILPLCVGNLSSP